MAHDTNFGELGRAVIAETERLTLRLFEPSDTADLFAILGSRETTRLMPGGLLRTEVDATELIEGRRADQAANGYSIWAVVRRSDGQLIGNCGFRRKRDDAHELGYLIDHHHWRQGYATEAATAAIKHAVNHLDASSIVATIRPGNEPSIAVALRLGMRQVESTSDDQGELLVYRLEVQ